MGNRKFAQDFFNQAVSAVNDANNPTRLNHAYQLFSSACLADPTWGEAWYWSGNNNNDLGLFPAAQESRSGGQSGPPNQCPTSERSSNTRLTPS